MEEIFDEEENLRIYKITLQNIASKSEIESVFHKLNEIFDLILTELDGDEDGFHAQIVIQADGVASQDGNFKFFDRSVSGVIDLDPWTSFCPPFWTSAWHNPDTKQLVKDWLSKMEVFLEEVEPASQVCFSEDEETHFGLPILSHLVLEDPELVPPFVAIANCWDMDHDVYVEHVVERIFEKYGNGPNTQIVTDFVEDRM